MWLLVLTHRALLLDIASLFNQWIGCRVITGSTDVVMIVVGLSTDLVKVDFLT